ncbi:MAG: SDR family NAD(P)-dependent oxidoreductase [Clostridia bacterium]
MKALITGASSGIGKDIAIYLSSLGIDIIAVARDIEKLNSLKFEIKTSLKILSFDLSNIENCKMLYELVKDDDIDILINNAGFGVFGEFTETNLDKEISMINTNIIAVHVLTKLFLKDMKIKNKGYILNTASLAGFMPGPLMSAYYATKSYVIRLSESITAELKKSNSNVSISVLCPGPVDTNFNNVANVKFSIKPLTSKYVAKYSIDKMFKKKLIILPGIISKLVRIITKIVPDNIISHFTYNIQKKKVK